MSSYTSNSDEEEFKVHESTRSNSSFAQQRVDNAGGQQGGGHGVLVVGAVVVSAIGIASALGARLFFGKKKSHEVKTSSSGRARKAGTKKVPPRRPRSVASSDVGSAKPRYEHC